MARTRQIKPPILQSPRTDLVSSGSFREPFENVYRADREHAVKSVAQVKSPAVGANSRSAHELSSPSRKQLSKPQTAGTASHFTNVSIIGAFFSAAG